MVWGAFSSKSKSNLVILDGKQNSIKYFATLFHSLLPFIQEKHSGNTIFQQDNASIHSSKEEKI